LRGVVGHTWQVPSTRSIAKAKARLGSAALKLLFDRVAGPVGTPDTPENAEHFGRGSNGSASPNPYPQLRPLALAEAGTRTLLAAAHGPSSTGEQTLAVELLGAMGP